MDEIKRKEAVDKIVTERGKDAVLPLLKLLQKCEEDEQTADMIREVLVGIGAECMPVIRKYVNDVIKCFADGEQNCEDEYSHFCMLYVAEVIGEIGEKKDIKLLNDMTVLYDDEKAHLLIYEAVARLGGGDQLTQLIDFYIFEDSYREDHIDQCIMILANMVSEESVSMLMRTLELDWIKDETRELAKNAVSRLIIENPDLISVLESSDVGTGILKEITFEDHGDEIN